MTFTRCISLLAVAVFLSAPVDAQNLRPRSPCGWLEQVKIPSYTFELKDENGNPIYVNALAYAVIVRPRKLKVGFYFDKIRIPLEIAQTGISHFVSESKKIKLKNQVPGTEECRDDFRTFVFEFNSKKTPESYQPSFSTEGFFSGRDPKSGLPIMPDHKRVIPITIKNLDR